MMINSREQLQTGRDLIAEFGSWSAIEAASEEINGVMVVVRNPDGSPRLRPTSEPSAVRQLIAQIDATAKDFADYGALYLLRPIMDAADRVRPLLEGDK